MRNVYEGTYSLVQLLLMGPFRITVIQSWSYMYILENELLIYEPKQIEASLGYIFVLILLRLTWEI